MDTEGEAQSSAVNGPSSPRGDPGPPGAESGIGSLKAPKSPGTRAALTIAVTSGKGGVGKTSITANLAVALAQRGHRVCVFDADPGLANIHILLGLEAEAGLDRVVAGERSVDEILLQGPAGIRIVPGASGIAECADLPPAGRDRLLEALESLESRFDYLLVDTGAGIARNVTDLVAAAQLTVLVVSPEPTSLTDAFAMLRVLQQRGHRQPARVLVNAVKDYQESRAVFQRFSGAVEKYLGGRVHYLGFIPRDPALTDCVRRRCALVLARPQAPASRCFRTLAQVLDKAASDAQVTRLSAYWRRSLTPSPTAGDGTAQLRRALDQVLAWIQDPAISDDELQELLRPILAAYDRRLPGAVPGQPLRRDLEQLAHVLATQEHVLKRFLSTAVNG